MDDADDSWKNVEQSENGHFVFNLMSGFAPKAQALIEDVPEEADFVTLWTDYFANADETTPEERGRVDYEDIKQHWAESHGVIKVLELAAKDSGLENVFYLEDKGIKVENFSEKTDWFFEDRLHRIEFEKYRKGQLPDRIWIKPCLNEKV